MVGYLVTLVGIGLAANFLPAAQEEDKERLKPANLVRLNTEKDEDEPHPVPGDLKLLYTSTSNGKSTIHVSIRQAEFHPWPVGKPLSGFHVKADCRSAYLTSEKTYPQQLIYATNLDPAKEEGRGDNFDLYFAIKQRPGADFTTPTPLHALCTPADELHPWLTPDGKQIYFSRKDKDGWHIYVASHPARYVLAAKATRVNLPADFHHPTLTPDGRIMYMQGPLEKGRWGLFRSTLADGKWSQPEPLTHLNHPEGPRGDMSPSLSRDGSKLFFVSDRPGGKGGLDIWAIPTAPLAKKGK